MVMPQLSVTKTWTLLVKCSLLSFLILKFIF